MKIPPTVLAVPGRTTHPSRIRGLSRLTHPAVQCQPPAALPRGFLRPRPLLTLTLVLTLSAGSASAGVISVLVKGGKTAAKQGAKVAGRETAEAAAKVAANVARKNLARLERELGAESVEVARTAAARAGRDADEVAHELLQHSRRVYQGANRCPEALEFGLAHGPSARALLKDFSIEELKNLGWTKAEAGPALKEFDRLLNGIGGSWQTLREAMTTANLNGQSRTLCEQLFDRLAAKGRMPGIPPGTSLQTAQYGPHGLDRFWVEKESGMVHFVEIGTGKKPATEYEMTWPHLREQWAKYVESLGPDAKIALRGQGAPQALLNPTKVRDPHFPIHDYVNRDIYAVERNTALLKNLGPGVHYYGLN